jgi:hypothetical protein
MAVSDDGRLFHTRASSSSSSYASPSSAMEAAQSPRLDRRQINIKKLQSTFKRSCYRPCSHRSKTAKIKRERERGRERDSGNSSSYEAYNTIA